MQKLLILLGIVLLVNTAQAQNTKPTILVASKKNNTHGHRVSNAAHQTYDGTEKGKIISQVARSKNQGLAPGKGGKAKGTLTEHPKAQQHSKTAKTKATKNTVKIRKKESGVFQTNANPVARANQSNVGRRPAGNGRSNHKGRG